MMLSNTLVSFNSFEAFFSSDNIYFISLDSVFGGIGWLLNDSIFVTNFCTIYCLSFSFFAADNFNLQIVTVRMLTANCGDQG